MTAQLLGLPAQGFHTTNIPRCALDVYQQYTYFDLTNLRCVLHQNSDTESTDQARATRSVASDAAHRTDPHWFCCRTLPSSEIYTNRC
jgi:hypothetical protein